MAHDFQIPAELQASVSVRKVAPADIETITKWIRWHGAEGLPLAALPPLGVVVEDSEGAAAALWCYESYGVGLASLEFAVTRPGLDHTQSRAMLATAIKACVDLAGKTCEPPGDYTHFKVAAAPAMVRFLERLGFRPYGELKQPMILAL